MKWNLSTYRAGGVLETQIPRDDYMLTHKKRIFLVVPRLLIPWWWWREDPALHIITPTRPLPHINTHKSFQLTL